MKISSMKNKVITFVCCILGGLIVGCDKGEFETGLFVTGSVSETSSNIQLDLTGLNTEIIESTIDYTIIGINIPNSCNVGTCFVDCYSLYTLKKESLYIKQNESGIWEITSEYKLYEVSEDTLDDCIYLKLKISYPCVRVEVYGKGINTNTIGFPNIAYGNSSTHVLNPKPLNGFSLSNIEAKIERNIQDGKVEFIVSLPKDVSSVLSVAKLHYGYEYAEIRRGALINSPGLYFLNSGELPGTIYYELDGTAIIKCQFSYKTNIKPWVEIGFKSLVDLANYNIPDGWKRAENYISKSLLYEYASN